MTDIRDPNLEDVVNLIIKHRLAYLHTMVPAKVVKYYPEKQTADLIITVPKILEFQDGEIAAVNGIGLGIYNVPIIFMRSSGFFISFNLKPDDCVMILFAEQTLEEWKQGDGKEANFDRPFTLNRFSVNDAVAFPGMYPKSRQLENAETEGMKLGDDDEDGLRINIETDFIRFTRGSTTLMTVQFAGGFPRVLVGDADQSAAIAEPLQAIWGFMQTWLSTHTHPVSGSVAGPSALPVTPTLDWNVQINSQVLKVQE